MAGVVEYIIKMQDALSGPLGKVTNNSTAANSALQKLTQSNKQLKAMAGDAGRSVNQLDARIKQLQEYRNILPSGSEKQIRAINSEINTLTSQMTRLQSMNGNRVKVWAKEAFSQIPPLLTNPLVAAGAGAAAALNMGFKASKEKLDFQLLVGDNAGSAVFGQLKKMRALLGDAASGSGKELLSAGLDVSKVTPTIERLAAVAGGSKEKFGVLSAAFSQVQRDGKLTEGTLAQLNDAGFKPLTTLQKTFGLSMTDLQKKLADGKIDIDLVSKALEDATGAGGPFANTLAKITNSPTGTLSETTDKLEQMAEKFGNKLMPLATVALGAVNTGLDWLGIGVDYVSTGLEKLWGYTKTYSDELEVLGGALLAGVLAYKGYQGAMVLSYLWSVRSMVADTALATAKGGLATVTGFLTLAQQGLNAAFIASPIGWIVGGIALITGGVIYAWKNFEGFRKVIYGLWDSFKSVFNSIGKLFKQIFSPIGEAIAAIKEGRWMDAAKATGKLLFNVSPAGILKNVTEFSQKGGWDVSGAYERGAAKGAASFAASQAEGSSANSATDSLGLSGKDDTGKALQEYLKQQNRPALDSKAQDGLNAISGGGVKNITVTVGTMIKELTFHVVGGSKEVAQELERTIEEAIVRAIASAGARG